MSTLFLLAALATIPHGEVVECRATCIEKNSVFSEDGASRFTQAIFWNEQGDERQCLGWRMWGPRMMVYRAGLDYRMVWCESDGLIRSVRAESYVESWTQDFDPEINARLNLPANERRGLGPPMRWTEREGVENSDKKQ